jgi:LmbE family N-acetylglucosaminyl deacetylase
VTTVPDRGGRSAGPRRAIVVAPHPDDEVLGAAGALTSSACTVVHVTDGVPPDADDELGRRRLAESAAASRRLGARVDRTVSLSLPDQGVTARLDEVADALARLARVHDGAIYVPAYQRGHPDHDAVYVAAQLARRRVGRREGGSAWFAYALYGLDLEGRPRYAWLEPRYFAAAFERAGSPAELERKAAALHEFTSQLRDDSVLWRWLDNPVPERYAPMPPIDVPLPELRCFYDEVFGFGALGIDPARTDAVLRGALATAAG